MTVKINVSKETRDMLEDLREPDETIEDVILDFVDREDDSDLESDDDE